MTIEMPIQSKLSKDRSLFSFAVFWELSLRRGASTSNVEEDRRGLRTELSGTAIT
jgi:hypothetical protein